MNPRPPPAADGGARSGGFVTALAWLSLAAAALGVLGNLMQIAAAWSLEDPLQGIAPLLPPALRWLCAHALATGVLSLLLSALLLWVSWALLQRREWARVAFIAFLLLGALLLLGSVWLLPQLVRAALALSTGLPASQPALPPELQAIARTATWIGGGVALAFAALHVGIAAKLGTRAVRAEFGAAA